MVYGKLNDELKNLIRNKNTFNYIKAQRLSWGGHVHQITNDRMVKKLYEWKLISTSSEGRPKIRWENDIKEDLRIMKINNWENASRIMENGRKLLRTKISNKEEEEEEEEETEEEEEEEGRGRRQEDLREGHHLKT